MAFLQEVFTRFRVDFSDVTKSKKALTEAGDAAGYAEGEFDKFQNRASELSNELADLTKTQEAVRKQNTRLRKEFEELSKAGKLTPEFTDRLKASEENLESINKEVNKTRRSLRDLGRTGARGGNEGFLGRFLSGSGGLAKAAGTIGLIAGTLGTVLNITRQIGAEAISLAIVEEEDLRRLRRAVGTLGEAEVLLTRLRRIAAQPGGFLSIDELQEAAIVLDGFNMDAEQVARTLELIAPIAQDSGASVADLARLWGEVAESQEVTLEVLEDFEANGIPIIEALADTLGKSRREVLSLANEGAVSFDALSFAFAAVSEDAAEFLRFSNEAETVSQKVDRLAQSWQNLLTALGRRLLPAKEAVTDFFQTIADGLNRTFGDSAGQPIDEAGLRFENLSTQLLAAERNSREFDLLLTQLRREFPELVAGLDGSNESLEAFADNLSNIVAEFQALSGLENARARDTAAIRAQTEALQEQNRARESVLVFLRSIRSAGADIDLAADLEEQIRQAEAFVESLDIGDERARSIRRNINRTKRVYEEYADTLERAAEVTDLLTLRQGDQEQAFNDAAIATSNALTEARVYAQTTGELENSQEALARAIQLTNDPTGEFTRLLRIVNELLDQDAAGNLDPDKLKAQALAISNLNDRLRAFRETLEQANEALRIQETTDPFERLEVSAEAAANAQGRLFDQRIRQIDQLEAAANETIKGAEAREAFLAELDKLRIESEELKARAIVQIRAEQERDSVQAAREAAEQRNAVEDFAFARQQRRNAALFAQANADNLENFEELNALRIQQEEAAAARIRATQIEEELKTLEALKLTDEEALRERNARRLELERRLQTERLRIVEAGLTEEEIANEAAIDRITQTYEQASRQIGQALNLSSAIEFLGEEDLQNLLNQLSTAEAQANAERLIEQQRYAEARQLIEEDFVRQQINNEARLLRATIERYRAEIQENEAKIDEIQRDLKTASEEETALLTAELAKRLALSKATSEEIAKTTLELQGILGQAFAGLSQDGEDPFFGFDFGSLDSSLEPLRQAFLDFEELQNNIAERTKEQFDAIDQAADLASIADGTEGLEEQVNSLDEATQNAAEGFKNLADTAGAEIATTSATVGILSASLATIGTFFNQFTEAQLNAAEGNEEEIAKIQRRAFIRNKLFALAQVPLQTAQGIFNIISSTPSPAWPFLIAGLVALSAAQAAVIATAQPPGFKEGVFDLQGPGTTTSDSIPARLSKGETVFPARKVAAYRPILKSIFDGRISPEEANAIALDRQPLPGEIDLKKTNFVYLSEGRRTKEEIRLQQVESLLVELIKTSKTGSEDVRGGVDKLDSDLFDWFVKKKRSI